MTATGNHISSAICNKHISTRVEQSFDKTHLRSSIMQKGKPFNFQKRYISHSYLYAVSFIKLDKLIFILQRCKLCFPLNIILVAYEIFKVKTPTDNRKTHIYSEHSFHGCRRRKKMPRKNLENFLKKIIIGNFVYRYLMAEIFRYTIVCILTFLFQNFLVNPSCTATALQQPIS